MALENLVVDEFLINVSPESKVPNFLSFGLLLTYVKKIVVQEIPFSWRDNFWGRFKKQLEQVRWILTTIPPAQIFQGQRASSKDLRVIFIQNLLMRVDGRKMKKWKFFVILSFSQGGFSKGEYRYKEVSIHSYSHYLVIYTGV